MVCKASFSRDPFLTRYRQAQTPEQRMRNQKFAKQNTAKMGKPEGAIKKKQDFKSPISPLWMGIPSLLALIRIPR